MKLYWRFKKDGKWSWRPMVMSNKLDRETIARLASMYNLSGEEE